MTGWGGGEFPGSPPGQPDPSAAPLQPINPTNLDGRPVAPRLWLAPNWVPMARVTALYGAGGEGKTVLSQMLGTSTALTDARWLGLHVRRCPSLLIFCEDDLAEMHRRQADINAYYGCSFADLGLMHWLPRLGEDCEFMVFENGRAERTPFFDQVLNYALEHQVKLIVTDTLSDVFAGNEIDRLQVRRFGRLALGRLALLTGAAVVVPAHPSLSGIREGTGDSASTGWKAIYRSSFLRVRYHVTASPQRTLF
jgi:RecA-family ATPase